MDKNFNSYYIIFAALVLLISGCREETIEPEKFGTVSGQVFDNQTLLPIEGASVSTSPTHTSINTDSLGRFKMENLPVGNYSLQAKKDNYITQFESITIQENVEIVVNINMEEEVGENQPPVAPQLITPTDGSENNAVSVMLLWSQGENYRENDLAFDVFLIDENEQEIEIVQNHTDTTFLLENLNYNTTYFWYVVAKDGVHPNANSELFSFKTTDITENLFLFVREEDSNYQVFSSTMDSSTISNLTNNNTNNWSPQYSPDGSLISYISSVNNANHIFVMDVNGNDKRKITSGVSINYYDPLEMDYCWSPDGTKILYMNFNKLYLQDINEAGGPADPVLTSPDGKAFASCDWKGDYIIARTTNSEGFDSYFYLFEADTYQLMDTIGYYEEGRVSGPYFSEDGGKIVYTHDEHNFPPTLQEGIQRDAEVFVIHDFEPPYNAISLSKVHKPVGTNDISARFSPSGGYIIFTNESIDGLFPASVYRMNVLDPYERVKIISDGIMPDWRNQ